MDLCYTPKLRWRPILAGKNENFLIYSSNINITMGAEGILGNFVLVPAWQPKITSDHLSFSSTYDGNCVFVCAGVAFPQFPSSFFSHHLCSNVCPWLISFKNMTFYACFSYMFALVFIIVLFYNINETKLRGESQHHFFCLLKFALLSRSLGRIGTPFLLSSQVRLALAFSFCGLSMFLLRLLSVFTSGHRFETACLNSLSKQLF